MYSFIIKNKLYITIGSVIIMLYGLVGIIKGFVYKRGFKKLNLIARFSN